MPSLKRSVSAAAIVCAALVVVAAATSAAGDPIKRLKAADQAYAKSIVLRKAELPAGSWTAHRTSFSQSNPACVVKHYSLSALTATGETGFTYSQGIQVIESDARVFLTAGQAARAFSILSSVGLGRCLGAATAAEISAASAGVSAKVTRVEPIALVGLAASALGVRIALRVQGVKGIASLHYVFLSVRRGRALATLGLVRNDAAWPSSLVRSLAAVTATRMTKH